MQDQFLGYVKDFLVATLVETAVEIPLEIVNSFIGESIRSEKQRIVDDIIVPVIHVGTTAAAYLAAITIVNKYFPSVNKELVNGIMLVQLLSSTTLLFNSKFIKDTAILGTKKVIKKCAKF